MRKKFIALCLASIVATPVALPTAAVAKGYYDRNHVYHRDNRRYSSRCRRSSGTTGLVAGGVGGALVGSALGGGTLGTLAGAGGGALLGRHLDKRHDAAQNRRNGC